jgi:hypothetical protein
MRGPLARNLVLGSAPGVIIGAVLRVNVADDPTVLKLIAAVVLLPTGLFILRSTNRGHQRGGASRTRKHLRRIRRRSRHLCGPPVERIGIDRTRLASRRCMRSRWAPWRLSRRIPATPDARGVTPHGYRTPGISLAAVYIVQAST